MRRATLVLLALLVACSRSEPPPAAPKAGPATVPGGAPPAKFSQASFPCCANDNVRQLVVAYTEVQEALARDDLAAVREGLPALARKAAVAAEDAGLSGDSRVMAATVAELAGDGEAASLQQVRSLFAALSTKVIVLAQANRGGAKAVAVAFSPVTNANWLQAQAEILNPYLGSLEAQSGVFRP